MDEGGFSSGCWRTASGLEQDVNDWRLCWRSFGTLWVRNITPDPETGIGARPDAAIARAIRSSLTPDGRVLYRQGMIWDHASNGAAILN